MKDYENKKEVEHILGKKDEFIRGLLFGDYYNSFDYEVLLALLDGFEEYIRSLYIWAYARIAIVGFLGTLVFHISGRSYGSSLQIYYGPSRIPLIVIILISFWSYWYLEIRIIKQKAYLASKAVVYAHRTATQGSSEETTV